MDVLIGGSRVDLTHVAIDVSQSPSGNPSIDIANRRNGMSVQLTLCVDTLTQLLRHCEPAFLSDSLDGVLDHSQATDVNHELQVLDESINGEYGDKVQEIASIAVSFAYHVLQRCRGLR